MTYKKVMLPVDTIFNIIFKLVAVIIINLNKFCYIILDGRNKNPKFWFHTYISQGM